MTIDSGIRPKSDNFVIGELVMIKISQQRIVSQKVVLFIKTFLKPLTEQINGPS
jgi:hypothetical protein